MFSHQSGGSGGLRKNIHHHGGLFFRELGSGSSFFGFEIIGVILNGVFGWFGGRWCCTGIRRRSFGFDGNHSGKGSSDLVVGRTMMYFGRLLLIGDGRNVSKAKWSHSIETEFWMTSDKAGVTNCALKTCHMDECFVAQWVCHGASLDSVLTNVTISFIKQIIIILVAVQSIVSTHKTLQFILLFATYWTFQTILKL